MELPQLISMEVSTSGRCDCYYRILAGQRVKYITVGAGALSIEALDDMPLDFQSILPPLPYFDDTWKSAYVTRNPSSSQLEVTFSTKGLPGVKTLWHPLMVDHLDIERTERLTLLAQECQWKTKDDTRQRMVAKMARFDWEVQYMEAETRMYQVLAGQDLAPEFVAHVHEAGRVIGFLLEKIPGGRNAEPPDLEACKTTLRRFHALGFVHGDCNKYNFIIRPNGQAVLIDFDHAERCTEPARTEAELASLELQLAETTGRGGGFRPAGEGNGEAGVGQ
ncbi:alpha-galactosidase A [Xylaria venustula]|nr:alpha-galactosidase A [Xylaria venustula]